MKTIQSPQFSDEELERIVDLLYRRIFKIDDDIQEYLKGDAFVDCSSRYKNIQDAAIEANECLEMRLKIEKYIKSKLEGSKPRTLAQRKIDRAWEKFFED